MLPEGKVIPRHNDSGHFYQVMCSGCVAKGAFHEHEKEPIYPSVTGKLQILKDEGLINYKMNKVIEYVFAHWNEFTAENIMDHLARAEAVPADVLHDAGDIGTYIHDVREKIFKEWIGTGKKPDDFLKFLKTVGEDPRAISGIRGLRKFVDERDYIPVECEMLLYSHALKVAGTLDDIGLMRKVMRESNLPDCRHEESIMHEVTRVIRCARCEFKMRYEFVLLDLKTSNQFKDHYFFQVALYYWMLGELLGREWRPESAFILKVSKTDGSYHIEDLKKPKVLARYCRYMLKTNEGIEFIKTLRKDNQRNVLTL